MKLLAVKNDYWQLFYKNNDGDWTPFSLKPRGRFQALYSIAKQLPQLSMRITTYGQVREIVIFHREGNELNLEEMK